MEFARFNLAKTSFVIEGTYQPGDYDHDIDEQCRLFVDGQELSLADSLSIRNHSPCGFNWGYGGSGPAQSALAICLHIFQNSHVAEALYQQFKRAFVAGWEPQKRPFTVTIDVADFLIDNRITLQQALIRETEEDEWKSWELVEEAHNVLIPPVEFRSPSVVRPLQPKPTSQYQIGDVVQTTAAFLDSPAGSRAVVYECYEGGGISIITEAGDDLGGFSIEDQDSYLQFLYHADGFTYSFRSVSYLYADWRRGVFMNVFR
ncbi:hypothetical protein DYU11_31900 [Fibrisoma montanum]|uniref:Uncharacterized protein n=2 Tax=Fibrisoma montanum TaxID=2305895 RepID=A0A418LW26_9BACT|nr:hypothetical protein DYU11_31900 [Fibrisoma montanum]